MTRARDIADLVDANGDIKSTALDNVSTDLVGDTTPQLGGDLDTGTNTIDLSGHTGAAKMAKGTTAQRPSTPAEGMFRLNTTTNEPEWYDADNTRWTPFSDAGRSRYEAKSLC